SVGLEFKVFYERRGPAVHGLNPEFSNGAALHCNRRLFEGGEGFFDEGFLATGILFALETTLFVFAPASAGAGVISAWHGDKVVLLGIVSWGCDQAFLTTFAYKNASCCLILFVYSRDIRRSDGAFRA